MTVNESAAVGLYVHIGELVEKALEDHESRLHVPPARRGPLQAIPFPDLALTDTETARAREMVEKGASAQEAADVLGVPVSVVERELAAFQPRWQQYLREFDHEDGGRAVLASAVVDAIAADPHLRERLVTALLM